ncbi:MAG TPA: PAS domain S-box protein [Chitinophagales bacterium]|nr:PAS domain S-box protein [Chitinophagales bacterium]
MLEPFSHHLSRVEELKMQVASLQQQNDLMLQQLIKLEKQTLESEIRFTQFYRAAFEGIMVCEKHQILFVNEAFCSIFGYEQQDLLNKEFLPLIANEYRSEFAGAVDATDAETPFSFEAMGLRSDGIVFPMKVSSKLVPFQGDEAVAITIQDITYDKKVEQELIESVLRYRRLFEESNDAIYITSVRGNMLEVNQAWLDLFGYEQEEVPRISALHLYADPNDRNKFAEVISQYGSVSNYEVTLLKKNGMPIECMLSTTTRRNMEGEIIGYQGIIRDITERKRTQDLVRKKEIAEKSAMLKEQFLANMSHEIRTPMNAVIGFSNLLGETILNTEQQKYLNGIRTASEHLLVIINDILDFSKIEAGRLNIETIDFSLPDVLNNVYQTFRFKAQEKNLDLVLQSEDSLPTYLVGDPTRIMQILLNLVSNAIKFTQQGSVTIDTRLFSEDAQTATIGFTVRDTGMGIPQEKLSTVFDSFTQVSDSTTRKFGGTGLGLTISKKLVEMQGGVISVKSEVGKGSSFMFVIKFKKSTHAPRTNSTNLSNDPLIKTLGQLDILLVEDNELNQVVAVETIKKWGQDIRIDVAPNGKVAIEKLQQQRYDIVLMDVQMPVMDGLSATKYIRSELGLTELPILAMTAFATSGEAERTINAGMNDYISKPFNPKKLYKKIVKLTHVVQLDNTNWTTNTSNNNNNQRLTKLEFLDEATGGDAELKAKMIQIILRETPEEIANMERFYDQKNWERLRAVAHKFKSAVTYIGLEETKEMVKNIQINAETQQNLDETADLIAQVKRNVSIACEELEEELKSLPHIAD